MRLTVFTTEQLPSQQHFFAYLLSPIRSFSEPPKPKTPKVLKFADQTSPLLTAANTLSRQLQPPPPLNLALDEDAEGFERPQEVKNLVEDLHRMEEVYYRSRLS